MVNHDGNDDGNQTGMVSKHSRFDEMGEYVAILWEFPHKSDNDRRKCIGIDRLKVKGQSTKRWTIEEF